MDVLKKILKFISSMRFAIILLLVLAFACSIGSLIPQGNTYAWYYSNYSERTAAIILALHLDDAFHSWWFILITAFLCINLLACNITRFPSLVRRTKKYMSSLSEAPGDLNAAFDGSPEEVFKKMGMKAPKESKDSSRRVLYSCKNVAGLWGAWFCHLGVLLLILGYALGQMTYKEYTVYGVPGDIKKIGDTSLVLSIDDFKVSLREDDTVEQYTADITVYDLEHSSEGQSAQISVNHPADLYGLRFYQNSTGWAAKISVEKGGEALQERVVCAGDYLVFSDNPDLIVYFNAFYPDYVMIQGSGPATRSGSLNNPAYLYSVYYQGQILGMNVLMTDDVLTIDDYTVTFSEPQSYTLIQIKRDSFTFLAFIGGVVIMAGLFLAFYVQVCSLQAVEGEDGVWTFTGSCKKSNMVFRNKFKEVFNTDLKEKEKNV